MSKLRRQSAPSSRHFVFPRPIAAAVATALGASLVGIPSGPVHAQDAEGDGAIQEVRITGSRILRRDFEAPSPITTVDVSRIESSANVSIESSLNELPQFKPGGTQYDAGSVTASATSAPGLATINLRGLGSNRTLVLIDGKRGQPANATLAIDVSTIPTAAIKSVEVITGGASAVYGADATAGVVNFVLRDDFEGIEVNARSSITELGDGGERSLSAAIGHNFGDGRGNIFVGAEFAKRDATPRMGREFFENGWRDPDTVGYGLFTFDTYSPGANRPSQAVVNSLFPERPANTVSPGNNFLLNTDGTVFQTQGGVGYTGPIDFKVKRRTNGDLNGSFLDRYTSSPMDRRSVFAKAEFALTDSVRTYLEGNFASTNVQSVFAYNPAVQIWNVAMPYDAAHPVPAELKQLLDSRTDNTAPWNYERRINYIDPSEGRNSNDVYQITAGLKGTLPVQDWTWDAYVSTGHTRGTVFLKGFMSYQRYTRIVTAPNYGAGFVQTGNYGQDVRCTSGLPVFQDFIPSQDCIDAVTVKLKDLTELRQDIAEASLQGKLFDTRAGEFRFAAGVAHRKNAFLFEPDPLVNNESIIENAIGQFATNDTYGKTTVSEVYAELLVPLLADLPAVKKLELELGGRYSDYNLAGGVVTYKGLVNWSVNDAFRLRGGYQRANRAPNVAELFQGGTVSTVSLATGDPCARDTIAPWGNVAGNPNRLQVQALCRALIGSDTSFFDTGPGGADNYTGPYGFFNQDNAIIAGSRDLESEKASTWTAGLVFQSPFESAALRNLTFSVDYYRIRIADAISPQDILLSYSKCLNSDGLSNPAYSLNDPGGYCKNILRDRVRGDRQAVRSPFINSGTLSTSGEDFQLDWRAGLSDIGFGNVPGTLGVTTLLTVLNSFKTQVAPGQPVIENAGTFAQGGQFDWRLFTTVRYATGPFDVSVNWQHLPSIDDETKARNPNTTVLGVNKYNLIDLNVGWQFSEHLMFRAGVDNLFDRIPPVISSNLPINRNSGNTNPGYYDTLGRRYYIGVRANL